jgi:LAGLIDADG endonuclease
VAQSLAQGSPYYTTVTPKDPSLKEKDMDKGLEISPLWLTGFIDGEGSFFISIYKNKNKLGWAVKPEFQISLHIRDKALLEKIQNYLQVGNLFISSKRDICSFRIQSPKDLKIIINHLDLYPLKTKKLSVYKLL